MTDTKLSAFHPIDRELYMKLITDIQLNERIVLKDGKIKCIKNMIPDPSDATCFYHKWHLQMTKICESFCQCQHLIESETKDTSPIS
jgi:hypothetical protein